LCRISFLIVAIDLHPPLDHEDPVAWNNFDEMSALSLRISLHEELARQWEAAQDVPPEQRDIAWHTRMEELAAMYREDIGCDVRERRKLEQQIETAIANGCHQTLAEILALFGTQARNGSLGLVG
jgi:hypothetical protein